MNIVSVRNVDTEKVIHHMPVDHGNYGTLCGVSTDDDMYVRIDTPAKQKINCINCVSIWKTAKEYRSSDFSKILE